MSAMFMSLADCVRKIFILAILWIAGLFFFAADLSAQTLWRERMRESADERRSARPASYEKIHIIGEASEYGIYDPSVEYDENGVGWMAYTAMNMGDTRGKAHYLETHLARSLDNGKTWEYINRANAGSYENVTMKGVSTQVVYREETPTLLYDPGDLDTNRRWKLFAVRGFSPSGKAKDSKWQYAHITYKAARTPEELLTAKEVYLFGSAYCKPPVCSVQYDLNSFHVDLKKTVFYEEPGSLLKDGIIYVTLSAVTFKGQNTILLASSDHGHTWEYTGTLTSRRDAQDLGYHELTSSSLAEERGRIFLLTSPVKKIRFPLPHLQYEGILIFEFRDISRAELKRDESGSLAVHKYLPPIDTKSVGGGQSEYHAQNTYGGIVMAQLIVHAKDKFQIFSTEEKILDK